MIRLLILTGVLCGLTILSNGQDILDKQIILQECIDLKELQQYYNENVEGRKPLIILNNGIIPTDLTLRKFGEPVQYMTAEILFFHGILAYLDFNKFEITSKHANIIFHYHIEGLTITLRFEKIKGKWTIKNRKLTEK